ACADGKHIVYVGFHEGTVELWRADGDGSNPAKLPAKELFGGGLCTPDSKSGVYAAAGRGGRMPIGGGTPAGGDLPNGANSVQFSRDGKLALYPLQRVENGQMQSKLVVAPVTGGAPLYTLDAPYGLRSAQFTPDGKAVSFLLARSRSTNVYLEPL